MFPSFRFNQTIQRRAGTSDGAAEDPECSSDEQGRIWWSETGTAGATATWGLSMPQTVTPCRVFGHGFLYKVSLSVFCDLLLRVGKSWFSITNVVAAGFCSCRWNSRLSSKPSWWRIRRSCSGCPVMWRTWKCSFHKHNKAHECMFFTH